jgi:hypothetical protein
MQCYSQIPGEQGGGAIIADSEIGAYGLNNSDCVLVLFK